MVSDLALFDHLLLDHTLLRQSNFSLDPPLTRHSALESNCTSQWSCDDGDIYVGSHDTFVLKPLMEWTESTFSELKGISPDLYGMENLLMWFFQTKLDYRVLNPCKILFVHHHHCVPIRGLNRHRVNNNYRSLTVGYSDRLGSSYDRDIEEELYL